MTTEWSPRRGGRRTTHRVQVAQSAAALTMTLGKDAQHCAQSGVQPGSERFPVRLASSHREGSALANRPSSLLFQLDFAIHCICLEQAAPTKMDPFDMWLLATTTGPSGHVLGAFHFHAEEHPQQCGQPEARR